MTRVVPRNELPQPPPEDAVRLEAGVRLGRYELLCPIAEGGMAQVWAAEQTGDLGFRKLVALKTIRPDFAYHASFRAMFLDEAQLASRIRHGNVVEVLDLGVDGDIVFQAMALIDGVAASEWMRHAKGPLPVGVAVRVAIDMLHGLHAAHTLKDDEGELLGLVHRDVSPQNVLVGSDGIAKLADFGIAKAFGRMTEETVAGDVKGKVAYVAPEQLRGLPAAPQSDLYAAGVVFWELLTGQRLFNCPGKTSQERRKMTARDPRTVHPSLPAPICDILMRALLEEPFERYDTSLEMADALEEAARRAGLNASHRAVATAIESNLGPRMEATRERLRQARKRAGMQLTPAPANTPRGRRETGPQSLRAMQALRAIDDTNTLDRYPVPPPRARETGPVSVPAHVAAALAPAIHTAPIPLPATRTVELDYPTDTVHVGATPQPMFEPPAKRANGSILPLLLAGVLLLVLVVAVGILGTGPKRAAAPPAPVAPQLPAAAEIPVQAPLPTEVQAPVPVQPPVQAPAQPEPAATPASTAAPAHRPILPHGRSRPVAAPAPAPAPKPNATIAPRFENPY